MLCPESLLLCYCFQMMLQGLEDSPNEEVSTVAAGTARHQSGMEAGAPRVATALQRVGHQQDRSVLCT